MEIISTPPLPTKLVFWLFLSVLSVAIAEVTVASAPFAFVNPFEAAFLSMFYGSHLLVFAWWIFRKGWPSFSALWLAGVLFGLYEFYVTKVLWAPPWGDTISMAHVDVVALIVLAFFWHPFMAFIFPLAIGEATGTTSRRVGRRLPRWLTGASIWKIAVTFSIAAICHGLFTGSPLIAFVSSVSATAAVVIVGRWWRRRERHQQWGLRELLPNDRQVKGLAVLLALEYAVFVPLLNPDSFPPPMGHVIVWLLYAGFAVLLSSELRGSDVTDPGAWEPFRFWPLRRILKWIGLLLIISTLSGLGPPAIGAIVVWTAATVAGLRMLIGTLRRAVRTPMATGLPPAAHDADPSHMS